MYFILKSASFPDTIGTIDVKPGEVNGGGSSDGSTPSTCTFTIKVTNPTSGATVTLTAAGYTQSGNSITVPSGTSVAWSVSASGYQTKTGTKIVSITSTQSVSLVAEGSSGGGGSEGDTTGYTALPTTKYALGVTSTGTGRVSTNNAKRFSTADDTVANGILIPNGKTLHLIGLASGTYPLRLDYIYCTDNVKCPVSGSTTAIEGLVGTASNYVSSNYFPLNTAGADAIDITNNYGADYYFWFGFAGQTLNEGILAEYDTYTLKYKID